MSFDMHDIGHEVVLFLSIVGRLCLAFTVTRSGTIPWF